MQTYIVHRSKLLNKLFISLNLLFKDENNCILIARAFTDVVAGANKTLLAIAIDKAFITIRLLFSALESDTVPEPFGLREEDEIDWLVSYYAVDV